MKYFFVFGSQPTLSLAEVLNVLDLKKIDFSLKIFKKNFLILKTKEKLNEDELQKRLGGTVKIGIIFLKIDDIEKIDLEFLKKELPKGKKIYFGFSCYGEVKERVKSQIKELALKLKKKLKEENVSSRWVSSKEIFLSSVIVKKNKLLISGAEFIFFFIKEKIFIGKTLTCQEFEEYEFYDFSRPIRKIEKGLIPPKLAKIMINLAKISEDKILLDPFCGSGTIINQAILMGYKNIIGTDISKEAVKDTQKNIKWLLKNLKFKTFNLKINIFQTDVRNLSEKISPKSIDAIVTEPYLGPLKFKKTKIKEIVKELSELYLKAFSEFKKVLKEEGKIVIVFPVFLIGRKLIFLPILDDLKKSGWQILNPFPLEFKNEIEMTKRNSIIYFRPNQKILREILIFTPNL